MSTIYARLIYYYKFKYHILILASFHKIIEEKRRSNENGFFSNLNNNQKLTEMHIKDIDVKTQLEHQIQIQESKDSGWFFDKNISTRISFLKKTGELK